MGEKPKVILARDLIPVLCKALGIEDGKVKRIVIDATYDDVVRVFVEHLGDSRMLTINWTEALGIRKVNADDKPER